MEDLGIYQKVILEHSKNPLNFKTLSPCTHHSKGNNPLCGDQVELFINVKDNLTDEICFQGAGCAISMASASVLTQVLNKKKIEIANQIIKDFVLMVENKDCDFSYLNDDEKELLMAFSEIKKFPMRSKCVSMSWSTFQAALKNGNYNTESKK